MDKFSELFQIHSEGGGVEVIIPFLVILRKYIKIKLQVASLNYIYKFFFLL
jgi:hypothetical protein